MAILGTALMFLGGLGAAIFGIMILIKAFQTSIGWGLGSLLVPFVVYIFVFTHWAETKKPFLYSVVCYVLLFAGLAVGIMTGASMPAH